MVEDQKLINLIDDVLFKTDIVKFNKVDLVLYNKNKPLNQDSENYNLNVLNHVLSRNIKSYDINSEGIVELNEKFKYLGYEIKVYDKKPLDLDLYGFIVFKEDERWTEYFNILSHNKTCLFIHHQDYNKRIKDYNKTLIVIQAKENIYIQFVKIY